MHQSVLRVHWSHTRGVRIEDATTEVPAAYWDDTRTLGLTSPGEEEAKVRRDSEVAESRAESEARRGQVEELCARVVHHIKVIRGGSHACFALHRNAFLM